MNSQGKIVRPFNTPLENGLRLLFILNGVTPRWCDLQRLLFYDYLLIHSGDVEDGVPSIHPPLPYRTGEWLVRRKLVREGLQLMFAKELVAQQFNQNGIVFGATELTAPFLDLFESSYASALRSSAEWLERTFASMADAELLTFMGANLGEWGAEFAEEPFPG